MKTRDPFCRLGLNSGTNLRIYLLTVILLFTLASTGRAAVEDSFTRVESGLSAVRMDLIHLYQSGALGPNPNLPASTITDREISSRPAAAKDGEPDPEEKRLRSIATLMARIAADGEAGGPREPKGSPSVDELRMEMADQLFEANLNDEAEKELKMLLSRSRNEATAAGAWFRLGKIYYREGDYRRALDAFQKISGEGKSPFREEKQYLAGNSYLYLKESLKAVDLLDRIAAGSDYYPYAQYSSGIAYLTLGDAWSSTQLHFQTILAMNPGEDPVLGELINKTRITLGFVLVDQKRYPEALPVFEAVPESSRFWIPARFGMGKTYMGLEDCVKAIVIFKELIRQSPDDPYALEARLLTGHCYSKLSAYRHAVGSYQESLKYYAERSDRLKDMLKTFQTSKFDSLPVDLETVSPEAAGRAASNPEFLIAHQDLPEWSKVYSEWDGLNRLVSSTGRTAGKAGVRRSADLPAKIKPLQASLAEIHQDLIKLLRSEANNYLSKQLAELDDLSLQANVGIAKNMTFMQDHEASP